MTLPLQLHKMGNPRYFDVYLDDPSSSEEEDHVDISRPLMSPRKYPRRIPSHMPANSNTPDTKLPKRKPVWYYKRKKDCLQAFYIVMVIMVIIIFALVLVRILSDAAKHRSEEDDKDSVNNAIHAFGNFALGPSFGMGLNHLPTPSPDPPIKSSNSKTQPRPGQGSAGNSGGSGAQKTETGSQGNMNTGSQGNANQAGHPGKILPGNQRQETVLPCTKYKVQDVWVKNIPQLMLESGIRLVDVNQDSVLDPIIGFATDVNAYFADEYLMCAIYFNGTKPCFGGVLALDGISGEELWRHYTSQEVFAVNCNGDVTGDGVHDCAIAGRAGVMEMVSGASGEGIWIYSPEPTETITNFYTAQFLHDIDDDGVIDILNMQGGDPVRSPGGQVRYSGKLMLMSGASGHVITKSEVPDGMESYYSPQIYYQRGGKGVVLFGTGGETIGGSLWSVPLDDLIDGCMDRARAIYTDQFKGVTTPPVLIDLTGDGVMDIVMAMFNSTIIAFDGQSYGQLWNYTIPYSESYSTPAAAYFNDDDVPDFMVLYNVGPGYPLYYYAHITVLDGRNGQPLLQKPIISSGSVTTSPLTISTEGYGNDAFFYWKLGCEGHESEVTPFEFEDIDGKGSLSRTDFCRKRFNSATIASGVMLSQYMQAPGQDVYNSAEHVADEFKYTVNATALAAEFLKKYPQVLQEVLDRMENQHDPDPSNLQTTEVTTPTPRHPTAATDLDFQSEYERLLAKLSTLSTSLDKSNEDSMPSVPGAVDSGGMNTRLPGDSDPENSGATNPDDIVSRLQHLGFLGSLTVGDGTSDGVQVGSSKSEAESPVVNDPNAPDSILSQDVLSKLQELGFPESWINPDSQEADPLESDDSQRPADTRRPNSDDIATKENPKDTNDPSSDLITAELKELLFNLLGQGKEQSSGTDVPSSHRYKRSSDTSSSSLWNILSGFGRGGTERHQFKRSSNTSSSFPWNILPGFGHGSTEFHKYKHSSDLVSMDEGHNDKRVRRHAGLHDAGGIQRVISTGTLAPRLSPVFDETPSNPNSIDVIFATYWFYPSAHELLTEDEKKCIESWMDNEKQRMDPRNEFYGLDHDAYEHLGSEHCRKKAKDSPTQSPEDMNPLNIYPFNLDAGELTVYRMRLTCDCGLEEAWKTNPWARCSRILPYNQQQWGAYMGTYGNSYFTKRQEDTK